MLRCALTLLLVAGILLEGVAPVLAAPGCGVPARGVVFVADDVGDSEQLTDPLRQALRECTCRLQVVTVRWSIGGACEDTKNLNNQRVHAQKLAARIMNIHHSYPGTPIYLVGFGGGAAVVLTAAEYLPPGTVARIVLLAPAVSTSYDLRRALYTSCEGIDVFFSGMDSCLHLRRCFHGNADGTKKDKSAGLVGFAPEIECFRDAYLYARLRQHRMDLLIEPYHNGDHHSYANQAFLHARVVPLLCSTVGYRR